MVPDLSVMTPAAEFVGEDDEETRLGLLLLAKARHYISGFRWCASIKEQYAAMVFPGVLGVSLFNIEPAKNAPPWVWTVTGDLPPAYLNVDPDVTPNAASALDCYVGHMEDWVAAVREHRSVDDLIPVEADPTVANADLLDSRLNFIDRLLLSQCTDDLRPHGRWRRNHAGQ